MDERGQDEPGHDDLHHPEPENRAPHVPEPARRQFQPDEEEQEGNTELGKGELRFTPADEPQPVRPDDRAGDQVAENGPQAEPAKDQHEQRRDTEQDRAFDQCGVGRRFRDLLGRFGGRRGEYGEHHAAAS